MNEKISRPVFALVLVAFLMPFVSVSCAGMTMVTVSGVDLVVGKEMPAFDMSMMDPSFSGSSSQGSTTVVERETWAIVAAVVAALGVLVGVGGSGVLLGFVGIGSLLALRWTLLEKAGPEVMGLSLDFEWGYWLALVGFAAAAVLSMSSPAAPKPAKPTSSRASPRRSEDSLRSCPFCEEMIPTDSAFCQRCGKDVSAIPPGVWS